MFVAGVVKKRKGFSSMLILSKKKNQHWTLYLDPRRFGQSHYNKGCYELYEHSEIHTYRVYIPFKWRVGGDNIDLR